MASATSVANVTATLAPIAQIIMSSQIVIEMELALSSDQGGITAQQRQSVFDGADPLSGSEVTLSDQSVGREWRRLFCQAR